MNTKNSNLSQRFTEIIEKDYSTFLQGLSELSFDELIDKAAEITAKQSLKKWFNQYAYSYEPHELKFLCSLDKPLNFFFGAWEFNEASEFDDWNDLISDNIQDALVEYGITDVEDENEP